MADASDRRRGLSIPFVPIRLSVPNPLAWLPRAGRLVRKRKLAPVAAITATEAARTAALGSSGSGGAGGIGSKVALKPASDVLAGALARAASQSTIHPLDTLKVRLQTRSMFKPQGLSKIGQLLPPSGARAAGFGSAGAVGPKMDLAKFGASFGSLYRGVLGAASGAGIAIGAYFAVYGVACNVISQHTDWASGQVAFVAGGVAAVGSSFVKVPLAVCIRSVQAGVYPNAINAAQTIVRDAGWRGLFTGYLPTVLEDVPDMAIKFAAYESMRQMHSRLNGGRVASPGEDFAIGAVSGAAAAAATTPLDVIKTNMMVTAASRPSMMVAARAVYAQGGPSAFFRGIGARALSNGINSAVFFAFFEMIRTHIAKTKAEVEAKAAAKDAMHSESSEA
ncbi:hypothetical protein FOA52_003091 [Chlamydomonas sp. UWO 241]|nr:hypothetical protein FOA52_003091 [Chlamydomonas sp. UWO 241]